MLHQPPPNALAPLASDTARRSRRWWRGIWIAGVLSIIALVIWATPFVLNQRKKALQTHAVGNLRMLGICLFGFECEFGKMPDATTVAAVRARTGTLLSLGTKTSNDFFRQLIASKIAQSETFFYSATAGSRKPDNRFDGIHALEKGECGFTYFTGASDKCNPSRPLAMTPMIPGTDRFDPKPFGGKAVMLRWDNSVNSFNINEDGHVMLSGQNLMDPSHPIWEGNPPVVAWPE